MKFAEHMLLSAKVYKLAAYHRIDEDARCALGLVQGDTGDNAECIYPWIAHNMAPCPCQCKRPFCNGGHVYDNRIGTIGTIIVHLFNEHVMQGGLQAQLSEDECPPWTMEQLADWIESVDPTEKQPDPLDPAKEIPLEPKEEPEELPAAITV